MEGAAHRNKRDITVRCTFSNVPLIHFYKYFAAMLHYLHSKGAEHNNF